MEALNKQKFLNKVSYVNNEIGQKSVKQLKTLVGDEGESEVYDLRLTAIKCTKKVLYDLLEAISMASKRLIKLRISSIDINDHVLMTKINETIYALPQLMELNLSSLKMNGGKLADLMQNIE